MLLPTVELFVQTHFETSGVLALPIKMPHIWGLKQLPLHHRDPFDRIMIAQAIAENMTFVSVDRKIPQYNVTLLK